MSKRRQKKTHSFQFRPSHNRRERQRLVEADFSVNFKKVFDSWLKFKDSLSLKPYIGTERLKHIHPTLFQVDQDELKCKSNAEDQYNKRNKSNLLYIDLNKIHDNVHLGKYDKKKLQTILHLLEYDEKGVYPKTGDRCKSATTTNRKINKDRHNKKLTIKTQSKAKNEIKSNNKWYASKTNDSRTFYYQCHSRTLSKNNRLGTKGKQRHSTTSVTVSQENTLKNGLDLDRLAYGDTVGSRIMGGKQISRSLNSLFKRNQAVNIKNIELKYLKPTYILQCYHNGEIPEDSERFYSSAALGAHLGQCKCPDYSQKENKIKITGDYKKAMHYDITPSHTIGAGSGTEQMRRQTKTDQVKFMPEEPSIENENEGVEFCQKCTKDFYSSLRDVQGVPPSSPRKKWTEYSYPSFLFSSDENNESSCPRKFPKEVKKEQESKCKPIADFVKACLCLSIGDKSDSNLKTVKSPIKYGKKEIFKMNNKDISTSLKRTTREDFMRERKS